jgi:hypothetical protein
LIDPGVATTSARRTYTDIARSTRLVETRVTRAHAGCADADVARSAGLVDPGVATDARVARPARLVDAGVPRDGLGRHRQGNGAGDSGVEEQTHHGVLQIGRYKLKV